MVRAFRLGDIVAALGGTLGGDAALLIEGIRPLKTAGPHDLAFLSNPKYQDQLDTTEAACVIVAPAQQSRAARRGAVWVCDQPYVMFARLTQWWAQATRAPCEPGIHPLAVVHPSASVHETACVGPLAVIDADAVVGEYADIGPQCHIGRGAQVGAYTRLVAQVTLGEGCWLGRRGLIHPGVVIGADGFGFAPEGGRWVKIEQLGAVRVGDDVEIGANTCIDRGALDDTVIEEGVKLDNLIQIGHNVHIGAHTAIAGCTGVAGSTRIGRHCTIAGAVNIIGHLEIADHVHISVATVVSRSIRDAGVYSGSFPMDTHAQWERNAATLRQLAPLRQRVVALERHAPLQAGPPPLKNGDPT